MDGLDYFKKMNYELKKANTTVTTTIKVDEEKIARKVAERMEREMSAMTTQSRGV